MVTLHLSYTSRINPSGVSPVLNNNQLWAGLQRKIRFAQEFVPVIESCEVLEDKDGVVKRQVVFKKGQGPVDRAREVVKSYWPSWVCWLFRIPAFHLPAFPLTTSHVQVGGWKSG